MILLLTTPPLPNEIYSPLSLMTGINYSDEIILTAIQFANACNPVLRANSQATLQR